MKFRNLSALFALVAAPVALFASSATDRKIEEAVTASYNYRTVLEDHVKVKAKDGVVTLTGIVQDNGEKELAADTVENMPGVLGVKNEIVVKATYAEHSDAWTSLKIRSHLLVKANVSASTTTVAVFAGAVTLRGTADSIAQKELTEFYTREIAGVKSVKNELVVQAPAKGPSVAEKVDDASITGQVKYALLTNRATSALKTKVVTKDGVIAITGEASSDAEKTLVTKFAEGVRGVKAVKNGMTVKS